MQNAKIPAAYKNAAADIKAELNKNYYSEAVVAGKTVVARGQGHSYEWRKTHVVYDGKQVVYEYKTKSGTHDYQIYKSISDFKKKYKHNDAIYKAVMKASQTKGMKLDWTLDLG